jgi:hypothetical protein
MLAVDDPYLHTAVSINCPVLAVNPVVVVGTELMVIVSAFAVVEAPMPMVMLELTAP